MSAAHTILVVEDNDFVRMQIVTFLKGAGYETVEARDGNAALDELEKNEIAVAVVDVRMEPMGGFEFITIMHEEGFKIPVILVTGDQNPDLLEQSNKHGVSTVLLKPVQKDRLVSMVGRLIAKG